MAPGGDIRHAALGVGAGEAGVVPAPLPPGPVGLIEATCRAACLLSTAVRDVLLRNGRGEQVDEILAWARRAAGGGHGRRGRSARPGRPTIGAAGTARPARPGSS